MNVVRFLVETCDVDISLKDRWGNTAIEEAKDFKQDKVVAYLQELMITKCEEGDTIDEDPTLVASRISHGMNQIPASRISFQP